MRRVRTRFAPSPTGALHIGGVRTALFCYLFSKKQGGDFLLRIEDTDQNRFVPGAEEYIIENLKWCGIAPDEGQGFGGDYGPYRQSERKEMYREYAFKLVESGHAYYAFDTAEELEAWREQMKAQGVPSPQYNNITRQYLKNSVALSADEVKARLDAGQPYTIRFKMQRNEEVKFEDMIRGWVSVNTNQLDDKVLFKSDGMPTYHLANVVDDYLMKITHVIRGEEWLPSAPLHVCLYKAFGWEDVMPRFAHLPLILRPDGNGKLSKRDGDRLGFPVFSLNWTSPETGEKSTGFRERGFFPEALVNFLALIGWNSGTEQEIFSMEELIEKFSLEKVNKAGAKFDYDKAKWFNQQYLRKHTDRELAEKIQSTVKEKGWNSDIEFLEKYVALVKERAVFINDLVEQGTYLFEPVQTYDWDTVAKKWKAEKQELLFGLVHTLNTLSDFTAVNAEKTVKQFMEENKLGMGDVLPNLRIALTGTMQGPPVFGVMELLGKTESIHRLETAFALFQQKVVA